MKSPDGCGRFAGTGVVEEDPCLLANRRRAVEGAYRCDSVMLSINKERGNVWMKLSVVIVGINGPQEAWPCWGSTVILGACKCKAGSEQDGKTHASVFAQSSVVQVAVGFAGGVSSMSARNRPFVQR